MWFRRYLEARSSKKSDPAASVTVIRTQRGNRREQVFFEDGDYELYLGLLTDAAARSGVAIWSYCLMPNHVHIIAVPSDEDGLRRTFRYVHRHYTGYINARLRVTGHLW